MSVYSVRLFPVSAKQGMKKGIRVEANSPKEAREKVLQLKGITEPCLTACKLVQK